VINERIKELRTALELNQRDFSQKAKIGHSTLAMFETGQRVPKEIHISQICQTFSVNEEWLKNGSGEMFKQDMKTILSQLSFEYHLDELDRRIIEKYLQLGELQRKAIKDYIKSLTAIISTTDIEEHETSTASIGKKSEAEIATDVDIEKEVESYRRELEDEKGEKTLPVSHQPGENAV
jgi:transcriptional regulator with XRE-family HTH domain